MHKLRYICSEIYNEEWSGVLFYSVKGTIRNPSKLKLTVVDFFPMDKGSAAHTAYTMDEIVVGYMMEHDLYGDIKLGHIHSHNKMGVFFSPEDTSELQDNVSNHNFYLSLIVNNKMEMLARVAYEANCVVNPNFIARDENGDEYNIKGNQYTESILCYHNTVISKPPEIFNVKEDFKERVAEIIKIAEKREADKKAKAIVPVTQGGYTGDWVEGWEGTGSWVKPKVTTASMDDVLKFILNNGKNYGYETITAILNKKERVAKTDAEYVKFVVENYLKLYMKYFNIVDANQIKANTFIANLDTMLISLRSYEKQFPFVINIGMQLESYKLKLLSNVTTAE